MAIQPRTTKEILQGPPPREFMLLAGMDGCGKTTAAITLAKLIEEEYDPKTKFHVIDTENGFDVVLNGFGEKEAPNNLQIYTVGDMEEAIEALDEIYKAKKPGDWVCVESMAKLWEYAQNVAYRKISGLSRAEYLEQRSQLPRSSRGAPIPRPDEFWPITYNAHNDQFLNRLVQDSKVNIFLTTLMKRQSAFSGSDKGDRAKFAKQFGLDSGLDGAPRLPSYDNTTIIMDIQREKMYGKVLKDRRFMNLSGETVVFDIPGPLDFADALWEQTGRYKELDGK